MCCIPCYSDFSEKREAFAFRISFYHFFSLRSFLGLLAGISPLVDSSPLKLSLVKPGALLSLSASCEHNKETHRLDKSFFELSCVQLTIGTLESLGNLRLTSVPLSTHFNLKNRLSYFGFLFLLAMWRLESLG